MKWNLCVVSRVQSRISSQAEHWSKTAGTRRRFPAIPLACPRKVTQQSTPPSAVYTRYFGTSSKSLPLSPFELSTSAQEQPRDHNTTKLSSSKSTQQVWRDLSDRFLGSSSTALPNGGKNDVDDDEQQNMKECIRWWSRQRPITRESQEYTWGLWESWKKHFLDLSPNDTMDLWMTVVDHWRLAVSEHILVRTPEQVLAEIRFLDPADPIKSYGILLDALSMQGMPEEAEAILTMLRKHGPEPSLVIWNTVLTAWARSGRSDGFQSALALLEVLEQESTSDAISYACVLEALVNTTKSESNSTEMANHVENLFARARERGKLSEVAWLHRLQVWGKLDSDKARSLLYSLRSEYLSAKHEKKDALVPNQQLFSAVMSAFARVGDLDAVRELWAALHELDEQHSLLGSSSATAQSPFRPSCASLNAVLQSFGYAIVPDRAEKAQALLQAAVQHAPEIVDRTSFNTVLDVWAGSSNRANVEAAQTLIQYMQQTGGKLSPDTYTWNAFLKCLSRSNRRNAVSLSRRTLDEMWAAYRAGNNDTKPNHISYSTILHTYSRLGTPDDVKDAEALFEELWNEYSLKEDDDFLPSEATYVSLITTWIRSKRKEAAGRAAYYFDHMRAKYFQTKNPRFQPSARIYNTLIDSNKLAGDGLGAEKALRRMIEDYRNGNNKACPTNVSFNTVMTAWMKSSDRKAPQRIERILREMEKLAESEGWNCKPNTWTFTIVLEAWSSLRSKFGAERAEAILRGLEQQFLATRDENIRLTNHCYTTVMNAWCRSGCPDAPERTQVLFEEMMEKFEQGDEKMRPGAVAYIALITAWARSGRSIAPSRALGILDEMERKHQLDPERYEKPESWHYSSVINAFAEQGDPQNAEAVLDRVLNNQDGVNPNRGCWNGILKAYAQSGMPDAPERAAHLLKRMYEHASKGFGESSPDAVVYTTLLGIWKSSKRRNAYEESLRIVQEMLESSNYRKRLIPDAGVFHVLFQMLQQSELSDKAEQVQYLVGLMKEHKVSPNSAIYKVLDDVLTEVKIL